MCGRYSFVTSSERLRQQLPEVESGENLRISYNIAPTHHAYVITNDRPDRLQYLIWGLIPSWSNDGSNSGKLINARKEGIETKPSFRIPIRTRRCLVVADSFYEWRTEGHQKVPYRILLKNGELMLLAGIWDMWYEGSYAVKSFSIITTAANSDIATIHDRMPVILDTPEKQKLWLSNIPLETALGLLDTPKEGLLRKYRVTAKLNSPASDSMELHQELPENPTLFGGEV
jgi:putative SOS response-associated peptidase YedK